MSLAVRLRQALDRADISVRGLHRALRERSVPSSSYGSVNSYVKGKSEPRRDWIEAAAETLGVRAEWLARGDGAMTAAEEAIRQRIDAGTSDEAYDDFIRRVDAQIDGMLAQLQWHSLHGLPPEVQHLLRHFLIRHFLKLADPGGSELRVVADHHNVDWRHVAVPTQEIQEFFATELAPALKGRQLGQWEFASAVLSQLAVLYLRYGALHGGVDVRQEREAEMRGSDRIHGGGPEPVVS